MEWARRKPWLSAAILLPLILQGCGTNPVTGKHEIQFVSQSDEIQMGTQNYAPARQSEGGDYAVLPELTAYVNEVGQKLAAASDQITVSPRHLPYEFKVLNNSVPNAWTLPGGKIAVNRGLLTELNNEAELAAVLGHEIVHAAARHGAQAQERGTLLQGGLAAAQMGAAIGGVNEQVAGLVLGGANIGAQLAQTRYGRDAELQADLYGTRLMKAAGYDPAAAVALQETFVRLSQGQKQNWLEGLFASHPPSQERVNRNRETVAQIGAGGDLGTDRYVAKIASLRQMKPAYDKYDQAQAALQKKNPASAKVLAAEAARMVPKEGAFQQLLGDIAVNEKHFQEALPYYERAQELNPGYFGSWLGAGVAQYNLKDRSHAEQSLKRSMDLMPTAPAALFLGNISRDRGDKEAALKYYQAAAQADGSVGEVASQEAAKIDLSRNPASYLAAGLRNGGDGHPVLVVQNRAAVPVSAIVVTPVVLNASGQIVQQARSVSIQGPIGAGQQVTADPGLSSLTPQELAAVRVRIDSAQLSQ